MNGAPNVAAWSLQIPVPEEQRKQLEMTVSCHHCQKTTRPDIERKKKSSLRAMYYSLQDVPADGGRRGPSGRKCTYVVK
jgi:hypothetical protein